jgi:hypothetical protein
MSNEHRHDGSAASVSPSVQADGVARAQLSQLFFASLDGSLPARSVTPGVCYCCKTAIATGPRNTVFLAWRHVYAGNMRDIALSVSRDGGTNFGQPVRVSEDKWQIDGCPEDGPTMVVDESGTAHVVWPTVVTTSGGPTKALFHASTRDGRSFTARAPVPTEGHAYHPQLALGPDGTLGLTWEIAVAGGGRKVAFATGRPDSTGRVTFSRRGVADQPGTYPTLVPLRSGVWLRASTVRNADTSDVKLDQIP